MTEVIYTCLGGYTPEKVDNDSYTEDRVCGDLYEIYHTDLGSLKDIINRYSVYVETDKWLFSLSDYYAWDKPKVAILFDNTLPDVYLQMKRVHHWRTPNVEKLFLTEERKKELQPILEFMHGLPQYPFVDTRNLRKETIRCCGFLEFPYVSTSPCGRWDTGWAYNEAIKPDTTEFVPNRVFYKHKGIWCKWRGNGYSIQG